jgi:hypothetical protein
MVPYITPQAIPPPTYAALHFLVKLHTEPYAEAKNLASETDEVFDPSGFLDHIRWVRVLLRIITTFHESIRPFSFLGLPAAEYLVRADMDILVSYLSHPSIEEQKLRIIDAHELVNPLLRQMGIKKR